LADTSSVTLGLARFVAAGFGSGWMPFAPGSFGSLAALLPAWWAVASFGLFGLLLMFVLLLPVACWSTRVALPHLADKDPGWVVIDEWLGQWLTLLLIVPLIGVSWWSYGLGLVAFRVFDIGKPGWVRRAEQLGPAWWSIHADDLVAGIFAGLVLDAGFLALHATGVIT
jgi:phosphatidylglycerophosphatase A